MALLSMTAIGPDGLLSKAKSHFCVAQTMGFGRRMSKMPYLSMGID
jgi:hypothetical protein